MNDHHVILSHIPPALLVVFRIGGLMIYGPVFGSPVIFPRVKVFLAFLIGIAVYPLLARDVLTGEPLRLELWSLAPLVGLELLIGLAIGFMASMPLHAMQTGGLVMGQQMGLGFARFYSPGIDDEADVVGQFLFFLAMASFLIVGGHESMVLAVLRSFEYVPLGSFVAGEDVITLLCGMLLATLELALRVAAPVLAIVFLESVAMGFVAKTVPQLNILSLGFPLRILIGIGTVAVGLVVLNEVVIDDIDFVLNQIHIWVQR